MTGSDGTVETILISAELPQIIFSITTITKTLKITTVPTQHGIPDIKLLSGVTGLFLKLPRVKMQKQIN